MNEREIVVDASAVLALLKKEPMGDFDPELLVGATISAVNLCEVLTKLASDGHTEAQANAAVSPLDLQVFAFDRQQANAAGRLWPQTRRAGLSLGDRACLALGQSLGCPVITTDRAWATVSLGIEIVVIR